MSEIHSLVYPYKIGLAITHGFCSKLTVWLLKFTAWPLKCCVPTDHHLLVEYSVILQHHSVTHNRILQAL